MALSFVREVGARARRERSEWKETCRCDNNNDDNDNKKRRFNV
jgi:hypothetical protein